MNTIGFSVLGVGLLVAAGGIVRGADETAPYTVVQDSSPFQVRDYPALSVVVTSMDKEGDIFSFRRLFRYISGNNADSQKISMTTPVFMEGDGEKRTMAFVLPKFSANAPQPGDPSVTKKTMPGGRFAVLRFSGGRSKASEEKHTAELLAWMRERGLQPAGSPVFGYFDPPWIPGFFRRNEVMMRVNTPGGANTTSE